MFTELEHHEPDKLINVRCSSAENDHIIRLITSAIRFFQGNALPWVEATSLENKLKGVVYGINNLIDWLGAVCELRLITLNHRLTCLPPACTIRQETASDPI